MKKINFVLFVLVVFNLACSGVETTTKKQWENQQTTISIKDLTREGSGYIDAGARLGIAIENEMTDSLFVPVEESASYLLRYKVIDFQEGSRWKRIATFGIDDDSQAKLIAKIALYNSQGMLGAWEVNSWVSGGMTGGTSEELFEKAAADIVKKLKGY